MGTQGLPHVDGSLLWSRASVPFAHPQNSSRPRPSCLELGPLASGSRAGGRPHLPGAPSALACAPQSKGRGEVMSHPQAVHLGMGRGGGAQEGFWSLEASERASEGIRRNRERRASESRGFQGPREGPKSKDSRRVKPLQERTCRLVPRLKGGEAPRSRLRREMPSEASEEQGWWGHNQDGLSATHHPAGRFLRHLSGSHRNTRPLTWRSRCRRRRCPGPSW